MGLLPGRVNRLARLATFCEFRYPRQTAQAAKTDKTASREEYVQDISPCIKANGTRPQRGAEP
jgi:hypothetical protein